MLAFLRVGGDHPFLFGLSLPFTLCSCIEICRQQKLMGRGDDKRQHTSYCSSFKISSNLLKIKILYVVAIYLYFVILLADLPSSEYSECLQ